MKRPKPNKGFDVLAFKEKAHRRIHKETKGMAFKELKEYYARHKGTLVSTKSYRSESPRTSVSVRESKGHYRSR